MREGEEEEREVKLKVKQADKLQSDVLLLVIKNEIKLSSIVYIM